MPSPRVFISSSYVDLADARSVVEHYFRELLYETVAFERGGIYYDHTKPLDLSANDAVKSCDLMILIIGGRYGTPSNKKYSHDNRNFNSMTKAEYLEALSAGIPIFTFIKQDVYNEYFTYINQPRNQRKSFRPKFVDNKLIFQLIKEIKELETNNLIIEYGTVSEILQYLKQATANLVQDAIRNKKGESEEETVLINGYKLFYHRRRKGFSHTELSTATKINRNLLTSLENVRTPDAAQKHGGIFRNCSKTDLARIEDILDCKGQLAAGKKDDLLSVFIQYYHSNKGKAPLKSGSDSRRTQMSLFPTKCVVFDFDGTLTKQNDRTTWELIWEELGYSIEDCARLHRDFSNKVITHREWCEMTCEAFNDRSITRQTLNSVASKIQLVTGVPELLKILRDYNIEMHILSGSINEIINIVLGELTTYFLSVQANSFRFAGQALSYIESTDFDFEKKADYVKRLMVARNFSTTDILFVGNSSNDKWVSRSGVATLCVNPHFTDGNDEKEWIYCIREMHDMREILKFIQPS